jgi:peptidyl-prolyl cis-trans isomerase B (cyclophilin B)
MKRAPKFLTLQTNCGNIVIETFAKAAPVTITVMSQLARAGYFDKTLCHRLTTEGIFVLQCGDPTASGSGGPTFRYRDENLPLAAENNYPAGSVAMANSGPNTNGSQFFLVYKDTTLGPNYTLWGKIVSGLEIVRYIAQGGVKNGGVDGIPLRTIAIERALTKNS